MKYQFKAKRYNFYPPVAQAPESVLSAIMAAISLVVLLGALNGIAAIVQQS